MKKLMLSFTLFILILMNIISLDINAQKIDTDIVIDLIIQKFEDLDHRLDIIDKSIDDLSWYNRISDIAYIDKVYITGPPEANITDTLALGAYNPVRFYTYIFIPRDIDPEKKYPLLVLPHGGVHAFFDIYHIHILREMIAQQYIVVAPDYRGSTGYGKWFYELIDYGGLENQDVKSSRDYMVQNYEFVDSKRVGIVGWSHGGMIALMNIFEYPNDYQVAFAGVPVSDLVARMGYADDDYRELFSAKYHIGRTALDNIEEYRRRSPVNHAHKLKTPLLIHTNTNDDDVHVLEVEHLIRALKAEGKKFEYEIYQNIPGGHGFDRIDTRFAKETRLKIYSFLAKELKPTRLLKTIKDIDRAAYLPLKFEK